MMKILNFIQSGREWFFGTPERALEQAYRAALKIRDLENDHFGGNPISGANTEYGASVIEFFRGEINGYLQTIRVKMTEFKTSRLFFNLSEVNQLDKNYAIPMEEVERKSAILKKLNFIDEVLAPYQRTRKSPQQATYFNESEAESENTKLATKTNRLAQAPSKSKNPPNGQNSQNNKSDGISQQPGVLPRSFLKTLRRIQKEIDPKSEATEESVLKQFRSSRYKTSVSIRFILLIIIVPLLTHQVTKTIVISPVVEHFFEQNNRIVFLNETLESEALEELEKFERSFRFEELIGLRERIPEEELEAKVKEKAAELTQRYRQYGMNSVANVFADLFSLISLCIVIVTSRRDIAIVKGFLDDIVYSLSDSAKAFMIILFTDMFVGFHSPHGWEVILENIGRHFGLPENRDFNFLFIATFPVILDTIFKYWIFRYLNRISPSAVATYHNMNE
jgi:hypothetical protein